MQRVTFTSKMDAAVRRLLIILFVILFLIYTAGLWFENNRTVTDVWVVAGCYLFTVGLILWLAYDITYEFREDYLFLRAGFLYTRIRYEDIESYRHLNGMMDNLSGFNLLSATNGIAILSQKVMLGEVKISPSEKELFIQELEKRMRAAKDV